MSMINGTRLYDHLTRLGRIGFVPKEGTTRLPYTPAYDEGRIYVQQCMEQAGLQTSVDPVGNLIGTLPGQGEIICIGSHIDTVPGGGIYDGTYGSSTINSTLPGISGLGGYSGIRAGQHRMLCG